MSWNGNDLFKAVLLGGGSGGSSGGGSSGGGEATPALPFGGFTGDYASGTFTIASGSPYPNNVEVVHDLGRIPVGCLLIRSDTKVQYTSSKMSLMYLYSDTVARIQDVRKANTTSDVISKYSIGAANLTGEGSAYYTSTLAYGATEEVIKFGANGSTGSNDTTVEFPNGTTYHWIVW